LWSLPNKAFDLNQTLVKINVKHLIVRQLKCLRLKGGDQVDTNLKAKGELSTQIATAIRDSIISGALPVDERLPSEAELCEKFRVSRPTVREALKRLAAQNLIRTLRGATGGAFVNRLSFEEAYRQQITTSTLLLSMNEVSFETACEARYALERACVALSAERFCDSDVAFHRALVDGAGNPVLSYQLAGAVEAMQPLMNMITFTARDRAQIIKMHTTIADAIEARDPAVADASLVDLSAYTIQLAHDVSASRRNKPEASV
jgi:GntR family transcriptional regulator, transcriptional repressor for pyruvate dehydrogenase complex